MRYPTLNEIPTTREMIDSFGGYNHNLRIGAGEFYDMQNLTSAHYPVLSTRPRRGIFATPTAPQGLIAKDAMCYVDGGDFVMGEYRVSMGLTKDNAPKTLISMGAYVIILPDKKYINTADITDYGSIEAVVTTTTAATFELCKIDGTGYSDAVAQDTEPSTPANMDLWIDTSATPHALKMYSSTNAMWVSIATTYIKISAPGLGKPFSVGDGVTLSDVTAVEGLNATMIIWERGDDYIVVTGILDRVTTQDAPITVARRMPNMDFVIESGNRLWGCRYGTDINGNMVNEIYASKLGDFKNWNSFAGISTDSYAATVGTDGQFTGAITHLGSPLFFKETCMHKVYGNSLPFGIQDTACRGVQKGCGGSLAIVNEVLYYKSRSAVCAYDGSLPVEISTALGEISYSDAVAGAVGNKYYISMKDGGGVYHLFVYDTAKGMWHREDNTQATSFCACRGDLYFIDAADRKIKTVHGTGTQESAPVKWMAETGLIGTDSPDKKYISRLDVRMSIPLGTIVDFYIQYDSDDKWDMLFSVDGHTLRSFPIPIRPQRCDHFRIRMEGNGPAKVYSICKNIEQGSEV